MRYVGEKPRRRGRYLLRFEKVGVLFRPRWLTVRFDEARRQYALSYHAPEHLVRHYPSLDAARDAAERLRIKIAKLDATLSFIPVHVPSEGRKERSMQHNEEEEQGLDDPESDESNMAFDKNFARTLASVTGGAHEHFQFEYCSYVQAEMSVRTNAVKNGGDSGHGFETEIRIKVEGADLTVGVRKDGDVASGIVIRAGGCDEALFLARFLELAGASIRKLMEKNETG